MNREYKFRGRNITTGEWVYGCLINNLWNYSEHHPLHGSPVCEIIVTGEATDWEAVEDLKITVDPKTVGQITGLQDKNKKDVYDGDICRTDVNGKLWVVRWGNYEWGFINHQIKEPKHRMAGDEQYSFSEYVPILRRASAGIEVIGNVYENPELINPSK